MTPVEIPFRIVRDYGEVSMILQVFDKDGVRVCGVYRLDGRINLPPRQWLRIVRKEIDTIEQIAHEAGCAEMRIAGRDWSRVLPDYEPLGGLRNGLRKAL